MPKPQNRVVKNTKIHQLITKLQATLWTEHGLSEKGGAEEVIANLQKFIWRKEKSKKGKEKLEEE